MKVREHLVTEGLLCKPKCREVSDEVEIGITLEGITGQPQFIMAVIRLANGDRIGARIDRADFMESARDFEKTFSEFDARKNQ